MKCSLKLSQALNCEFKFLKGQRSARGEKKFWREIQTFLFYLPSQSLSVKTSALERLRGKICSISTFCLSKKNFFLESGVPFFSLFAREEKGKQDWIILRERARDSYKGGDETNFKENHLKRFKNKKIFGRAFFLCFPLSKNGKIEEAEKSRNVVIFLVGTQASITTTANKKHLRYTHRVFCRNTFV